MSNGGRILQPNLCQDNETGAHQSRNAYTAKQHRGIGLGESRASTRRKIAHLLITRCEVNKLIHLVGADLGTYRVSKSAEVIVTTTRERIISQIQQIAKERDKRALPRLTDDVIILESGLDSLELAILVARLEDELGLDPFSSADEVDFPVTFGDVVRLYENGIQGANNSEAAAPSL